MFDVAKSNFQNLEIAWFKVACITSDASSAHVLSYTLWLCIVVGCFALHRIPFLLKCLVNLQNTILFEGVIRIVLGLAQGRPASFRKWKVWGVYLQRIIRVFSPLLGLLPRSQTGISIDPYLEGWDTLLLTTDASHKYGVGIVIR